ncbi:Uncharacterised protein [Vibrio cholerae]|nr:Uncharacterised protein [Vibrio cholerae]
MRSTSSDTRIASTKPSEGHIGALQPSSHPSPAPSAMAYMPIRYASTPVTPD